MLSGMDLYAWVRKEWLHFELLVGLERCRCDTITLAVCLATPGFLESLIMCSVQWALPLISLF